MKSQKPKTDLQNTSVGKTKTYDSCELMIQSLLNSREMIESYIDVCQKKSSKTRRQAISELNAMGVYLSDIEQ